MTVPKETTWEAKPHTKAKHEILRRYLGAWFAILGKSHPRIVYIDGFCGPGCYSGGESGSPIVVLNAAINHGYAKSEILFWFVDNDEEKINFLKQQLKEKKIPGNLMVKCECGEFATKLEGILKFLKGRDSILPPTFVFIDPFGFKEVPFALIKGLLEHPRCEVLVTFMVDSMNRWLTHHNVNQHIVDFFGTEECLSINQMRGDRKENLRKLYQRRLEEFAKFVCFFEMKNRKNRPIYFLFFATNNEKGHKKMKEAMCRVDQGGKFVFSDAKDPNQISLKLDNTTELEEKLVSEFKDKGILTVGTVREYVENETDYFLEKHMKAVLKSLESLEKIKVEPFKTDGKKRRKNTFPDNALVTFF